MAQRRPLKRQKHGGKNEFPPLLFFSKIVWTRGKEQFQKDFDKLPGKKKVASDGVEYKELPDGKKIIKRPAKDKTPPTLEVQYPKGEPK